ncbi:hypothetical protein [Rhizobium sullae]|uniref:hypothetical protein n=1 Tax=Rhizobium sullae TaxID=50338 RepID=UPI0015C5BF13|nr:hypothetical protein [Rhizobium sullae]
MQHLVQNDIVEAFCGLLRQVEIEPDGSHAEFAAASLGFQALHEKTMNTGAQLLFPFGINGRAASLCSRR